MGTTSNWSDDANWRRLDGPNKTPHSGDALIFPDGARQPGNTNDIKGLTLGSISFPGTGYDLSGQAISLTGGITSISPTGLITLAVNTVEFSITITQAQSFTVTRSRTLDLNGGIDSSIGTSAALALDGSGTVALGGTSVLGSNVDVQVGTLLINGSLEYDVGTLTVEHTATLTDAGSVTTLKGGIDDHGQITVAGADGNRPAGSMSLQGDLTIERDGSLTDAGSVTVASKHGLEDRGNLTVQPGGVLDDLSSIKVEPGATLEDQGSINVEPQATLDDAGTLAIEPPDTPVLSFPTLDDQGALTVEPAGILNDGGALTVEAHASLASHGTLEVRAHHTLAVSGNVVLAGTSQQPAVMKATLTNSATPVISLRPGATLGLDATGTGTTELNLSAASDFAPAGGQPFTLVANATGQPVRGVFDDGNGQPLSEGATVHAGDAFAFTISYQGGQGYLDVVLTGVAPPSPQVKNLLSVPLSVDGQLVSAGGLLSLTTGTHTLSDPNAVAGGSVTITVTQTGNVNYDPALDGTILSGLGTPTLIINGRTMTIDTSALAIPTLTLDGTLSVKNTAPTTFTDLPGTYALVDSGGAGAAIEFTLNAADTVGYDPLLEGILTGAGTANLVVHGVAVQIQAVELLQFNPPLVTSYTVSGQTYPVGVQTISLLPGAFTVQYTTTTNLAITLDFTVSPGDQVTFNPSDPGQASLARVFGNTVLLLPPPPG
jgi:hypothetical protein